MSAPVIPGFAFIEHLGSGGFADVFLYEQQWPRQRVAVPARRQPGQQRRERGRHAARLLREQPPRQHAGRVMDEEIAGDQQEQGGDDGDIEGQGRRGPRGRLRQPTSRLGAVE